LKISYSDHLFSCILLTEFFLIRPLWAEFPFRTIVLVILTRCSVLGWLRWREFRFMALSKIQDGGQCLFKC